MVILVVNNYSTCSVKDAWSADLSILVRCATISSGPLEPDGKYSIAKRIDLDPFLNLNVQT